MDSMYVCLVFWRKESEDQIKRREDPVVAKTLTTPMIFNNSATDSESYKKDILPVAIICNNNMLGNKSAH
jgi:hypothetical protein